MKILEAQSAILTNYEVHQFLLEQKTLRTGEYKKYEKKAQRITKDNEQKAKKLKGNEPFKPLTMQGPRMTRRPRNLETIVRELLDYFNTAPSPLASKPYPYDEHTIRNLLAALRPWDFTKAEIIMIINLRPTQPEILNTIVEMMEQRFPGDEQQGEICTAIRTALGAPNADAERQAMLEGAQEARDHENEAPREDVEMVDE